MEVSDDLYRIGTVANLTGVAVERLRAWERRYGLAPAHRDGRTRYYSGAQLSRLKRIKQLIDQGHPISSLAGLSHEQLGRRLAQSRPVAEAVPQVGLVGPNVVRLVPHEGAGDSLQVAASWVNMAAFVAGSEAAPALDALIVQVPVLTIQPIEYIKEKFPDTHIVLVYQYAADKHLRRAQDLDAHLLEWPVDWPQLAQACAAAPRRAEGFAERRFTDAELVAMATSDADPSGLSRTSGGADFPAKRLCGLHAKLRRSGRGHRGECGPAPQRPGGGQQGPCRTGEGTRSLWGLGSGLTNTTQNPYKN